MIEKYGSYEFCIVKLLVMIEGFGQLKNGYYIFNPHFEASPDTIIESSDYFYDTEQEARFAAIGHIILLENGES